MSKINKKELVDFLIMESEEHFETILNGLLVLEKEPENWSIIDELFRSTHTIKGSAAMVGFVNVSTVAHKIEDILEEVRVGKRSVTQDFITSLINIFETLSNEIKNRKDDLDEKTFNILLNDVDNLIKIGKVDEQPLKSSKSTQLEEKEDNRIARQKLLEKVDEKFTKITEQTYESYIRIKLSRLDSLLNLVGELITNKNRQIDRVRNIQNLSYELEYVKKRFIELIRDFEDKFYYPINSGDLLPSRYSEELLEDFGDIEFDRYDHFNILSRKMQEIGNDIVLLINNILSELEFFYEETGVTNRIADEIQEGITSIRLVPIDRLFSAATRAARGAAVSENKKIRVHITGENIELDKTLIDALTESIIHIVRNAVSHGIESPEIRKEQGKPEEGNIYFRAKREASQVIIEIEDDGRGFDLKRIRETAIKKGLLDEYEAHDMRADKLLNLVFFPGFSTSDKSSETSGRGVGLDVVKRQVESLSGSVTIINRENSGACFQIIIPVSLLIAEYLIIKENSQVFCIPIISVYEIFSINKENIKKIGERDFYKVRDDYYEIYDLGAMLGQVEVSEFKEENYGVLLEGVKKPYVIIVDEILGREVTVTKKIGKIIEGLKHISGATISPRGEIRFIIDPLRLIEKKTGSTLRYVKSIKGVGKTAQKVYIPNSILIVDDSISIRKFLTSVIKGLGFAVDEAIDGANALEKLESNKYDLIITDLEMPVMNGYELIEKVRGVMKDSETKIFVLTSRATEKHREKAIELGADDFLVKPLNEDLIKDKIKGVMLERA